MGKPRDAHARLVFRPNHRSDIGLVGGSRAEGTIAQQWFVDHTPAGWDAVQCLAWATERGLKEVSDAFRKGRTSWVIRAVIPGQEGKDFACNFKSGITLGPVQKRKRKTETVTKDAKSTWGVVIAPVVAPRGANANSNRVDALSLLKAVDDGVADAIDDDEVMSNAGTPAASDTQRASPGEPPPAAARRKVEIQPSWPTFDPSKFNRFDKGGEGDCGCCVIGADLHGRQPKAKRDKVKPIDLLPKGKVQADLRTLACAEMVRNWETYLFMDKAQAQAAAVKMRPSGEWSDSRALYALAQAAQLDLRIWAYSSGFQRWHLHHMEPWKIARRDKLQTVWMRLEDFHYELLHPKDICDTSINDGISTAYR